MSEKSKDEKAQPTEAAAAMQSKAPSPGRRNFLKYTGAGVAGFVVGAAVEFPILNNQIQQDNAQISTLQGQVTSLNGQVTTLNGQLTADQQQITTLQGEVGDLSRGQGFLTLNPKERLIVEAVAETIIPTDASGPGAKEAGVIYFIDRMLAGSYGKSGNMFMQGPFVRPTTGALTIGGIDYPGGTIAPRLQAGTAYQYAFPVREFWRRGLMNLEDYSNSAYGGDFETLIIDKRTQILQDLFDNKPTNFAGPTPAELFNEFHDMVTAGYWTDPLYGGNIGMMGWNLLAFPGVNNGITEGTTTKALAIASTPTRLPPMSLADIDKGGMH